MVTLFLLYQKSYKRSFFVIQYSISIILHHNYGGHSRKYYCKSIHLLSKDEAEQTADCFSGQTQISEGVPGEENCPEEAGGDCLAGQAMAKEF